MRPAPLLPILLSCTLLPGCQPDTDGEAAEQNGLMQAQFQLVGKLESSRLNEASGVQVAEDGRLFLHNDEGARLYFTDVAGRDLGFADIDDARNRDWEDITRVPGQTGPMLVIGDIGDNDGRRKRVSLYFVPEPPPGERPDTLRATHRVRVEYPDGPRDAEAMAYDAAGDRILVLTKRDRPPRLYGIPLDLALWKHDVDAEFLGEVPGFRPPTRTDMVRSLSRGQTVSQPTGMDISPDGRLAAVITYRSLYLFRRDDAESWPEAMQRAPQEIIGPPGLHDEGVAFTPDGRSVIVVSEGRPAPLFRLDLPPEGFWESL